MGGKALVYISENQHAYQGLATFSSPVGTFGMLRMPWVPVTQWLLWGNGVMTATAQKAEKEAAQWFGHFLHLIRDVAQFYFILSHPPHTHRQLRVGLEETPHRILGVCAL